LTPEQSALAWLIAALGQYLATHADDLSGQLLFVLPILTTIIGGVLPHAWIVRLLAPVVRPIWRVVTARRKAAGPEVER
jgi:hypothetical protein